MKADERTELDNHENVLVAVLGVSYRADCICGKRFEQGKGSKVAHAPRNAVSAANNHALYLEPRTKMMQHWADSLEVTERGGKVLPFPESVA